MIKKLLFLFILLAAVLAIRTFKRPSPGEIAKVSSIDLDAIRKRGKLIAVTDFNSIDYFIYKGEPMGFNYELLKSFSDFVGIDLEIIAENNIERACWDGAIRGSRSSCRWIDCRLRQEKKDIVFTSPVDETRQVLVQRKPRNWRKLTDDSIDKMLIRNQKELAKKIVYVQEKSSNSARLAEVEKKSGKR